MRHRHTDRQIHRAFYFCHATYPTRWGVRKRQHTSTVCHTSRGQNSVLLIFHNAIRPLNGMRNAAVHFFTDCVVFKNQLIRRQRPFEWRRVWSGPADLRQRHHKDYIASSACLDRRLKSTKYYRIPPDMTPSQQFWFPLLGKVSSSLLATTMGTDKDSRLW